MMEPESRWIGQKLIELTENANDFVMLNVGSSTKRFREVSQPHINDNVFKPLQERCRVDHLDIKAHDGVDLVGDLTNPDFQQELKLKRYDAILCSNLLEHVRSPIEICRSMEECVKSGGYLIVTVPYLYPYHNDPIDTMFRPDVSELSLCFENSSLEGGAILNDDNSYFTYLFRDKKVMILTAIRWLIPFYKFEEWKKMISYVPHIFTSCRVTCVVMRKNLS